MSEHKVIATSRGASVRYRLLAIALVPMLVILPLLLGVSIYRWNVKFDAMTMSKVNDDLTIVHQYMGQLLEKVESQLASTSNSAKFSELISNESSSNGRLSLFLGEVARQHKFNFVYVIGRDGNVIASGIPMSSVSIRSDWPIIKAALDGKSRTSLDVFERKDLAVFSSELAQRAQIEIVPVEAGNSSSQETRGLVLQSASPVVMPNGERVALVAGVLLNKNLAFVDAINDLIYHDTGVPEGSHGTVTLFLDDIRISTNVTLFEGTRAIGTRVSADVRTAVLDRGKTWRDSAFVVNDWYISAYEPILDSYGRRVGMLYAGFLQKPLTQAKYETLLAIAAAFLIAVTATVPLFLTWASSIFRPLERMSGAIDRVECGDLSARTGAIRDRSEIGQVAQHLDHLLDLVQERDQQLRDWNKELNERVEARALELQDATLQLETTTKQLVMSEKLAAIGEITAGVAHEINNPIAVMQGNLEVIRDLMGPSADKASTEFRLIDEQMHRITELVTKLLQFAKPQEYAGYTDQYTTAGIVSDTLPLVQHLLKRTTISVDREDRALQLISINRTELQQVLVNLIVNAIHAMPQGGRLTLRTYDSDMDGRDGVAIEIADTGGGMLPDVMQRIFDPFFTTKTRDGTGLGLSISQMLVTRQGGKISVRSEPDIGTTFTVWLPAAR